MADRTSRDGGTRRQASRRVRADAGLPDEYLELLEQKRKQLDESIHKYIASKERDYKNYERELQQQYKQEKQEQSQDGGSRAVRTSTGSTGNGTGSPQLRAQQQQQQQQSVVDALLAAGVNQEHIGQPLSVALVDAEGSPRLEAKSAAGLIDRQASIERDKEFVGVFTPAFLPALDDKASSSKTTSPTERAESAPPGQSKEIEQPSIIRAHSDHIDQAKAKRPVQLQLTQRTSSSGSSADGKLTSALKSPTQGPKPKRKRVSLAVGDSIVKPSDSVPTSLMNNNRTPSHSRTRSQTPDPNREQSIDAKIVNGNGTKEVEVQTTSPQVAASLPVESTAVMPEITVQRSPAAASATNGKSAVAPSSPLSRPPARPPVTIDADGDLFDLEEEDMLPNGGAEVDPHSESEDAITGRVGRNSSPYETDENSAEMSSEPEVDEYRAEHVEFVPGSAVASQQPTNPGFRRPSVAIDPIYSGANYDRAEYSAVVNEVYGSSYNRAPTKGSFTSGSLGESFMARNSHHVRTRSGSTSKEQMEVRS